MGSVHEGVKQVAFGMLIVTVMVIHAMRASIRRLAVADLMQVTHSCQHRGCQRGKHQQEQHREAQQSELVNEG